MGSLTACAIISALLLAVAPAVTIATTDSTDASNVRAVLSPDAPVNTWQTVSAGSSVPPALSFSTMALINTTQPPPAGLAIMLYGGTELSFYNGSISTKSPDCWVFSLNVERWNPCFAQLPTDDLKGPLATSSARVFHSLTPLPQELYTASLVLLFGGINVRTVTSQDGVTTLDGDLVPTSYLITVSRTDGLAWTELTSLPQAPSPRCAHTTTRFENVAIMYGGCTHLTATVNPTVMTCLEYTTDAWMFDATAGLWHELQLTTPIPKLFLHSAAILKSSLYIITGLVPLKPKENSPSNQTLRCTVDVAVKNLSCLVDAPLLGIRGRGSLAAIDNSTLLALLPPRGSVNVLYTSLQPMVLTSEADTWMPMDADPAWTAALPEPQFGPGPVGGWATTTGDTLYLYGEFFRTNAGTIKAALFWQLGLSQSFCQAPCSPELNPFYGQPGTRVNPPPRTMAPMFKLGSTIYLFGGEDSTTAYPATNVWSLDLNSDTAWQLSTLDSGSVVPRLFGVASAALRESNLPGIVQFSGSKSDTAFGACSKNVYTLHPTLNLWTKANCPAASVANAPDVFEACLDYQPSTGLWLFGGLQCSKEDFTNDLFLLPNSDGCNWVKIPKKGTWPNTTGYAASAPINDTHIVYFGGITVDATSNVAWILDTVTQTFSLLSEQTHDVAKIGKVVPGPRRGACLVVLSDNAFVISGGAMGLTGQTIYKDTWVMWLSPKPTWLKLDTENPVPRHGQGCVYANHSLLVFGGTTVELLQPLVTLTELGDLSALRLGCNAGSFSPDFATVPCKPCPLGTYASAMGATRCNPCPGETYTTQIGAANVLQCDDCVPGFCHHGHCVTEVDSFTVTCNCEPGYSAADRCRTPWAVIVGVLVGLGTIGLLIACSVKIRHRYRRFKTTEELHERLLQESAIEIEDLTRAWTIQPDELTVEERIAQGAQGEVFRVSYAGRPAAVKKMLGILRDLDEKADEEFEREVRVLRSIRHANIVMFLGFGTWDGFPFLVTEFCEGGSLYDLLYRKPLQPVAVSQRVSIALDAAKGMAHLHGLRPVRVHRDFKSANLLLDHRGVTKVADFGQARLLGSLVGEQLGHEETPFANTAMDDVTLTKAVGTFLWSAPEILRAQPYGQPCDVYSYAIVLYELLQRKLPWESFEGVFEIRAALLSGERPQVDEDTWAEDSYSRTMVVSLMEECWQDDPALRPTFPLCVTRLEAVAAFTTSQT
eukprot:m.387468 g.387468  ORF g.387468 m.387468 type:complete len:1220 (-) comp20066_c3_seq4:52-3711(-)